MTTPPLISVIIVSWNVADSLGRCLDSIFSCRYPSLEVFVIDNASTDASAKVAKSYPVKFTQNTKNLGFPKSVNIGLRQSRGAFLLVLNPDTRLPKDFFTKSIQFFKEYPQAGLMGPKLLNPDGIPQGSVFPEPSLVATFRESWLGVAGLTAKYVPPGDQPVVVPAVSGSCLFFPRTTLDTVGLFTEEVFMYFEDLDYCRRLRRLNLAVYFNPGLTVVHEHGSSARQSPEASDWRGHLWSSSLWYNGPLKHYTLWLIAYSGQKLHSLFH